MKNQKPTDKGNYNRNDPLNQVITVPKAFLREIKKPEPKAEEKDYSFEIPVKT